MSRSPSGNPLRDAPRTDLGAHGRRGERPVAPGVARSGVGTIVTGVAPLVVIAMLGQAVAGLGNGIENIAADTLIQRAVPSEMLGRVFGLVATAPFAGSTLAYAAGGFLLDPTGSARTVFVIGGAGVLVVLVPLMLILRREVSEDGDP